MDLHIVSTVNLGAWEGIEVFPFITLEDAQAKAKEIIEEYTGKSFDTLEDAEQSLTDDNILTVSIEAVSLEQRFHGIISREAAICMLEERALKRRPEIMSREYGEDEDWCGIEVDDLDSIKEDKEYKSFELWGSIPTKDKR